MDQNGKPSFEIPDLFEVQGLTIKVEMSDDMSHLHGDNGIAMIDRSLIQVQKPTTCLDKSGTERVFCHELVHILLESIGRNDLSTDETLVESLGGALHQALKTSRKKHEQV